MDLSLVLAAFWGVQLPPSLRDLCVIALQPRAGALLGGMHIAWGHGVLQQTTLQNNCI